MLTGLDDVFGSTIKGERGSPTGWAGGGVGWGLVGSRVGGWGFRGSPTYLLCSFV